MPRGPISCGFKVPKRIATLLCFGWIKKTFSPFLQLCLLICFYFCHAWCLALNGASCHPYETLFTGLFCGDSRRITCKTLFVSSAHKQDHLAIISSQYPLDTAKRMFIKKNGRLWERRKIGQVKREARREGWRKDEKGWGWGGGLLELRRGHGVPVERNSGKHP